MGEEPLELELPAQDEPVAVEAEPVEPEISDCIQMVPEEEPLELELPAQDENDYPDVQPSEVEFTAHSEYGIKSLKLGEWMYAEEFQKQSKMVACPVKFQTRSESAKDSPSEDLEEQAAQQEAEAAQAEAQRFAILRSPIEGSEEIYGIKSVKHDVFLSVSETILQTSDSTFQTEDPNFEPPSDTPLRVVLTELGNPS